MEGKAFTDIMRAYHLSASQVRDAWQWVHLGKAAVYENVDSGSSTDVMASARVDQAPGTEEDAWAVGVNLLDSCPPNAFRMRNPDSGSRATTAGTDAVRDFLENLGIRPGSRPSTCADLQGANQVSHSRTYSFKETNVVSTTFVLYYRCPSVQNVRCFCTANCRWAMRTPHPSQEVQV